MKSLFLLFFLCFSLQGAYAQRDTTCKADTTSRRLSKPDRDTTKRMEWDSTLHRMPRAVKYVPQVLPRVNLDFRLPQQQIFFSYYDYSDKPLLQRLARHHTFGYPDMQDFHFLWSGGITRYKGLGNSDLYPEWNKKGHIIYLYKDEKNKYWLGVKKIPLD